MYNHFETQYQQFIYLSKYARWIPEKKRRERWPETVERYFFFFDGHLKKNHKFNLPAKVRRNLKKAILGLEVMPSMRCLMTAGPALERDEISGYNCAYTRINKPKKFDEIMYVLMCGTGMGFSVEHSAVDNLPAVHDEMTNTDTTIVVQDSRIGWAKSLRELISLLYGGRIPKWDLSRLRPAGSRLKTFGGRSSGPEPLENVFKFAVATFSKARGRKLTSLECHDMICKIAQCIVAGGVRRSALISLSDLEDEKMREAKFGAWYENEKHRQLANNSAVYLDKPEVGTFMKEWISLYNSKSGERGIFNRDAANRQMAKNGRRDAAENIGSNPCNEILLLPDETCNLSDIVIREKDKMKQLIEKVKIATILGTIQSTLTNYQYLSSEWKRNNEHERLLGVSITGILDNEMMSANTLGGYQTLGDNLDTLREVAIKTNKEWAKKLGINQSAAITCVKPSGTVSQLVNSGSGIHPRHNTHYIRRVRCDKNDPLTNFMVEKGFPHEQDIMSAHDIIFSFPIKTAEAAVTRHDLTAIQHLELWKVYQDRWCVTGDTLIMTNKGHLQIKNCVNKQISIWNGEKMVKVKPYATGRQLVYRVVFSDGSTVDMTSSHKIIMKNGEKKMLKECKVGDKVFNSYDLPHVDNGRCSEHLPHGYSQGFYAGNGYSKGDWTLIYKPKYEVIKRIKGLVKENETLDRGRYWKHSQADVVGKNFVPKRKNSAYQLDWLAGILDSDGSRLGNGFQISSVDFNFIYDIKIMLTTLGCKSSIQRKNKSQFGVRSCYYLNVSGQYSTKLKSLGLKCERVRIKGSVRKFKDKYLTIISSHQLKVENTYCFTEPEKGQGVFNGILLGQCEHKPSITVSIKEDEWLKVGSWVYDNFDEVSGIAFLPHAEHIYKQAPYEDISEQKYISMVNSMPINVKWDDLSKYEEEDTTVDIGELSCFGGKCDL